MPDFVIDLFEAQHPPVLRYLDLAVKRAAFTRDRRYRFSRGRIIYRPAADLIIHTRERPQRVNSIPHRTIIQSARGLNRVSRSGFQREIQRDESGSPKFDAGRLAGTDEIAKLQNQFKFRSECKVCTVLATCPTILCENRDRSGSAGGASEGER